MGQLTRRGTAFDAQTFNKSIFFDKSTLGEDLSAGPAADQQQTTPLAVSLLLLIAIPGLFANLLVLRAIFILKRRKLHEYLILNLAITDLGTCTISIPLDVVEKLTRRFPFGAALCHVVYPLQSILVYVSVMTLLLMSGERFRLIVTPMKRRIELKRGILAIHGTWILSFVFALPLSLALRYENSRCIERWENVFNGKAFTLIIFLVLYIIPLIIMTISYACMLRVFYNDSKSTKLRRNLGMSRTMMVTRTRRNLRIIRVLVVAVVAFAICMLPTHVSWLWHDFGNGSVSPYFDNAVTFSNIVMYFNSVLNPFIFGSINMHSLTKYCRTFFLQGRYSQSDRFGRIFQLRVRSQTGNQRSSISTHSFTHSWRVKSLRWTEAGIVSETANVHHDYERETVV